MRFLRFLPLLITLVLIWLLDTSHGILPPIGRFVDPIHGALTAAEPVDKSFSAQLKLKGVQQPVSIELEDRLVPHISAQNDHDLYFAQGYIHAYFRLWQMDMQTRAAGGRVSEVVGAKAFKFDQGQRRKGMVYAAERSLKAMEAEPRTKAMLDAYTEGINSYISSLNYRDLPLEYKLLNFKPETWTNIRSALLLKYMADDLTGASDDIAYSELRDALGQEQFDFLFADKAKGTQPVIPEGTAFDAPSLPQPAYPGDRVWARFNNKSAAVPPAPHLKETETGIGSNNWAVSGKLTASGAAILCNDPHLGLNLPSLWFEVQLTAPGINSYGVSLPGAPGVIIGFNDHLSWGFTNNYRDVKDYYDITASNRDTYLFNGKQEAFIKRPERIIIKDSVEVTDTVLYTVHGPVQYEPRFPDPAHSGKMLAMCWMAHRGTNELLAIYLMNRATDYNTFSEAIRHFQCPAQNFAYADKQNNIAIWGQGQFINKWKGQGRFVMEGKDNLTLWGEDIPMTENPHVLNPAQGYVASANQSVTDDTYPYWYNGSFSEFRSWEINNALKQPGSGFGPGFTPAMMEALQQSTYSELANRVAYKMVFTMDEAPLNAQQKSYVDSIRRWSYNLDAHSNVATFFQLWWYFLYKDVWSDEWPGIPEVKYPAPELTAMLLRADTQIVQTYPSHGTPPTQQQIDEEFRAFSYTSRFFDDKRTPAVETREQIIRKSFMEAYDSLQRISSKEWYAVKNTSLTHLARIPAFSYTGLETGGWGNTIKAMKGNHGPSWRMVVEMTNDIHAYGVYPGGQSGNPGSIHYGDNVEKWAKGLYYPLQFVAAGQKRTFTHHLTLIPA